ncbi:unnamed protein product [Cylindrotheca closterium]|uniref:Uncharacterized protein n=1 Tax=Cylindrotheca closterium TaxID=2856 RepID=A0AAD2FZL9_9STRA|nr:unnamed protein product [Cylindrotheca closterium]
MKTSSVAALALTALYERDSVLLEQKFQHLTAPNLKEIDTLLWNEEKRILKSRSIHDTNMNSSSSNNNDSNTSDADVNHCFDLMLLKNNDNHNRVLAQAVIRRLVFQGLGKFRNLYSIEEVEEALVSHTLPQHLQETLVQKYGDDTNNHNNNNSAAPNNKTWKDALDQLVKLSGRTLEELNDHAGTVHGLDKRKLWELILEHPMTAYEPFKCQHCGQVTVQDDATSTPQDNEKLGLSMVEPNGSEIGLRGGWFRGRPYSSTTIFQLKCTNCGEISRWYRSGHPKMLLNPSMGWGRLCGEQEDLRLHLASYLGIPIRMCLPLDWDHVWTEFLLPRTNDDSAHDTDGQDQTWDIRDDSARNFAVRLDEGIGSWTGVLAISPDPDWCQDVTNEYLSSENQNVHGRADSVHATKMPRYRELVEIAQRDTTGDSTQAKTVIGFILKRANWSPSEVSETMKRASTEYGSKEWWDLVDDDEASRII